MTVKVRPDFLMPGKDFGDKGTAFIVYGDPGVGKTSLVKTLLGWTAPVFEYSDKNPPKLISGGWGTQEPYCEPEEILVVNVEAGESMLTRDDGTLCCTLFQVLEDNMTKLKELVSFLREGDHPFKYVFVDNMSELEKFFLMRLADTRDLSTPRQKEWGDSAFHMRKCIRDIRGCTSRGINVIFNFWSMSIPVKEKDGESHNICSPMVMRSTTMEYVGLVDHTAYMGISKTGARFLQFESKGMYTAKKRSDYLDKFEEANLAEIFRKVKLR